MSDIPVTFLERPAVGKPVRIAHNNQEGYTAVVTQILPDPANPKNYRVWTQAGVVCNGPIAVNVSHEGMRHSLAPKKTVPSWVWVIGVIFALALIGSLLPSADQILNNEAGSDPRSSQILQELQVYMSDNFGGCYQYPQNATSWFEYIKKYDIELQDDGSCTVCVTTEIWNDADAPKPALAIANAVLGFDGVHVKRVSVFGVEGGEGVCLLTREHW